MIYKTTCSESYDDYATELADLLNKKLVYCQFDDEAYERVDFKDILRSRERSAILAMRYYCIVKGRGPQLVAYSPEGRVSRAELIKMLYKSYAINQNIEIQPESIKFDGKTPFADVGARHWAAQYVAGAYELGWLTPLESKNALQTNILPNKSVTKKDIMDVLDWIDEGAQLESATIDNILGDNEYPTRAVVAELITQIFLQKFLDYFFMQDNNRLYYQELLKKLEGKSYSEQYTIIQEQIEQRAEAEKEHGTYEDE
ncbi:MAG: S-layer homology domain-containing protein [Candidatus Peribacteria bacterium]|nr:MAG: S-layer homology domain-containing protein [Candidatus Peribacteria bacterium]